MPCGTDTGDTEIRMSSRWSFNSLNTVYKEYHLRQNASSATLKLNRFRLFDRSFLSPSPLLLAQGTNRFNRLLLNPLTLQPPIQHLQTGLRLIIRDHVAAGVQTHESEVGGALHRPNLGVLAREGKVLERSLAVGLLARPLELTSPGEVAEPLERLLAYIRDHEYSMGSLTLQIKSASPA